MTTSERVHRTKRWGMWVGSQSDLRTLLRIFDEHYLPLVGPFIETATSWERRQLENAVRHASTRAGTHTGGTIDGNDEPTLDAFMTAEIARYQRDLDRAVEKAESDILIEADVVLRLDERRTVALNGDDLSKYLEDKRPSRIELRAPKTSLLDYKVALAFDDEDGVSLSVSSDDGAWVSATYSDLQEAITRNSPKWGFVRQRLLSVPIFAAGAFVAWYFILDGIGDAIGNEVVSASLTVAYGVLSLISIAFGVAIYERKIKAFEVVPLGQKATARALFGLLGSNVIAIVIGIGVNILTK